MSTDVLERRRGIIPLSSERAQLEGYQLVFQQPGLRLLEPCFADIQPTAKSSVHGVLYRLTKEAIIRIDCFESSNYQRYKVKVNGIKSGRVSAWTYRSRYPIKGRRPSQRYRNLLITGALEFDLPTEYLSYLKETPCVHFPVISWLLPCLIEIREGIKRKTLLRND